MANHIQLITPRLILTTTEMKMAKELSQFYIRNKEHLAPWEDMGAPGFFTVSYQRESIRAEKRRLENNTGIDLWIRHREAGRIIGKVSVFGIIGGNFSLCVIGYKLDKDYVGYGYMTEALSKVEWYLFDELNFHRIEINIIPYNERSIAVAKRCGYTLECLVKNYIYIDGSWKDHYRFVKSNPSWKDTF